MNKWLITLTTTLVVLVVAAFALHREQRVARSVDIAASPEKVWSVLTDFAAYAEWNPFMREASGTPEEGEKLRILLNSGDSEMTFTPTVLVAVPGSELRWLGRVYVPGLLDGEHTFTLEPIPGGVRLTQSETFSGVLVPFFGGSIDVGDDFAAMNEALRDRAESTASIAQ